MNSAIDLFGAETATAEISLYEYQGRAVQGLRENIRERKIKNQVLSAPTGSGKTVVASYLIHECYEKRKKAVFVCDRIPLIEQTSATFDRYGIPHGVMQANHWRHQPWERIQVCSGLTLSSRGWPPDLDLIVVDECHTFQQSTLRRIGKRDCVTIGLTATAFVKGLGRHYEDVVNVTTTNQLIAEGYLAPFDVWAASEPDMEGAKVVAGDWTEDEKEKRALPIVGDCVSEYLKHGAEKKFICFGVNIRHCEELQKQFLAAGVHVALYTVNTPDEMRAEMVREFRKPDSYIRGLISVSALAKGFDVEDVGVIIMARPLRSGFAEHIQILGRGLRRDPNDPSKRCVILDHAGNMMRFWPRMQDFFENGVTELDDGKKKEGKAQPPPKAPNPRKCPKCAHVHSPRPMCPMCGHQYPRQSKIEHKTGELQALTGVDSTGDGRQALFSQLVHIAMERGYKDGWASWAFKDRTGNWPDGLKKVPTEPTIQVRNWVKSRQIARAKARG